MIPTSTPKINKKKLLWLQMEDHFDNTDFLRKYAPKYYTKADFDLTDLQKGNIFNKTKSFKIIRQVKIKNYSSTKKNFLLQALKPKRKLIQTIDGPHKLPILQYFPLVLSNSLNIFSLSSWRTFLHMLNIQKLKLDFKMSSIQSLQELNKSKSGHYLQWRFWKHLIKLQPTIKNLYLHMCNKIDGLLYSFLEKLSSQDNLLSSLQDSTLFLNYIEDSNLSHSYKFPNIYKQITTLNVHELSSSMMQRLLTHLGDFEKLQNLSIIKTMKGPEDINQSMDFTFFSHMQRLPNLHVIELLITLDTKADLFNFLQTFALPQSARTIKLIFHEIDWNSLVEMGDFPFTNNSSTAANLLQSTPEYLTFCQKWKDLTHLESLTVCFVESEADDANFNFNFVASFLKNIPNLSKFYYANSNECSIRSKNSIDFNMITQSISHLKSSLTTLYIETPAISLTNFARIPSHETNSVLRKLGLCGTITGDTHFSDVFSLSHFEHGKSGAKFNLEVESLVVENKKSFGQLLKGLSNLSRGLSISIEIDLRKVIFEDFAKELSGAIPHLNKRNFSKLSFTNLKDVRSGIRKELTNTLKRYEVSNVMKIMDRKSETIFLGESFCKNEMEMEDGYISSGNGIAKDFSNGSMGSFDEEYSDFNEEESTDAYNFFLDQDADDFDEDF